MKKLISLLLALALVMGLAVPALAAEPTVTGDKEGDVTANYTPVIKITDIVLSEYDGNGSVTVDAENKTYTVTVPADADETAVTVTVSGQNLDKASEDYLVSIAEIIKLPFTPDYYTYDSVTGNVYYHLNVNKNVIENGSLSYSTDGGETWTGTGWSVVVEKEAVKYNVTVNAAENGTVTASSATAAEGETVELFVTADEGYELDTLSVMQGGNSVDVAEDHTFVMPAGDVAVTATFKAAEKAYNITINESENGTVAAKVGEQQVTSAHHNDDVTLVVTPDDGYRLKSLTVKDASGDDVTVTDSNTFVMPESNVTVTAVFEKVYTISLEYYTNCTVSYPGTAAAGETVTVTIAPDTGCTVTQCNVILPPSTIVERTMVDDTTFTFIMPEGDVIIAVTCVLPGTDLETVYYKGPWTDVRAYFLDSENGNLSDPSVEGKMVEAGIYAFTDIPDLAYNIWFTDSNGDNYIRNLQLPTDGKNMYNAETGEWETYSPSQPPEDVTSADIAWGSLAYTYSDETGEWTTDGSEGAGTVTVKNTGDTTFSAQPSYTAVADYDEIEAKLYNSEAPDTPITMGYPLASEESITFLLKLFNQPEKAIPTGTKIGTVTIKITEGSAQ